MCSQLILFSCQTSASWSLLQTVFSLLFGSPLLVYYFGTHACWVPQVPDEDDFDDEDYDGQPAYFLGMGEGEKGEGEKGRRREWGEGERG